MSNNTTNTNTTATDNNNTPTAANTTTTAANNNNNADNNNNKPNLGAACFRCRGFRHACDRKKPSCSRCHRRGITCVYPEAAPTLKKLQKATETLGDRIKKFGDRLKVGETPLSNSGYEPSTQSDTNSVVSESIFSTYSEDSDDLLAQPKRRRQQRTSKVASTNNFSVYPCTKCFKDLQQCDLSLPRCSRCQANDFECCFKKTEPKANHVSQVLTTMNKVMDQWQDSIDRMAKDFAQKTRDFSAKANHSLKVKPIPQTSWKITTTRKGLSVESNVNSYNDLSKLVDQFKKSMTIKTKETNQVEPMDIPAVSTPPVEFDDTSSIHTSSGFSFAIWNSWNHPTHAMPEDYPIDISQELTDNLINLYCRTPCCSSLRLPIINTVDFLKRYHDPNPENRPSTVLIYAICAMAARNAFQLHVWSKRSSFEAPQYNMGKALSVAYCLKGRELLSECFDEPTLENCQAAFLLSYCNQQNGYPGVIYFYEWIAYNMALELGLYQPDRKLTRYESILIWCIYYCNTWYRILQSDGAPGSSINLGQCKPASPIPDLLPVPASLSSPFSDFKGESHQEAIDYYVWNSWVYLIKLQVLRGECMLKFMNNQSDRSDASLTQDVMSMQSALQTFHDDLPPEWKNDNNFDMSFDSDYQSTPSASPCSPGSCTSSEPSEILGGSGGNGEHDHYSVDIKSFSQHCINFVNINYYVNQIILHQAFIPMHRLPTTPISIQSLQISLNAADQVNRIISIMVHQREECHVPLISLLFANIIHRKLISYSDQTYSHTGKYGLLKSIDIAKSSINYVYDFEMARTLVSLMEQEVKKVVSIKDDDMISLETPSSMLMI